MERTHLKGLAQSAGTEAGAVGSESELKLRGGSYLQHSSAPGVSCVFRVSPCAVGLRCVALPEALVALLLYGAAQGSVAEARHHLPHRLIGNLAVLLACGEFECGKGTRHATQHDTRQGAKKVDEPKVRCHRSAVSRRASSNTR